MTNTQRAKLDSCNRVKEIITLHAKELSTIAEFAAEQENFLSSYGIIINAAQVQSRPSGTADDAVLNAKTYMANVVIKYALRGLVKAKQLKNLVLASQLDQSQTYILQASKNEAVQRSNNLKDQLKNNLSILTNITSQNIAEIERAIIGYDTIKDHPTIDKQNKAATGTDPLPQAFAAAFTAIDNMYDLITSYFADTNPSLVKEIELAKQIINTGIHHTGITGTVTKNDTPLKGVTVTIVGTNKSAITDIDGHFTIARIKSGNYTVEATTAEGEKATKNVHINKGNFETVNIRM